MKFWWQVFFAAFCTLGSPTGYAAPAIDLQECYGETIEYELPGKIDGNEVSVSLAVPIDTESGIYTVLRPAEWAFQIECLSEPVRHLALSIILDEEGSEELFGFREEGTMLHVQLVRIRSGRYEMLDPNYKRDVRRIEYGLMTGDERPHVAQNGMIRIGRPNSLYGTYISGPDWSRPNGNPMTFSCIPTINLDAQCETYYSLKSGLLLGYRVLISGSRRLEDLRDLDAKIRTFVQQFIQDESRE